MVFGGAPDSAPLAVQLGQPVASGRKEMEVPVTIAIPVDAVTFIPLDGKYTAEVELRVAATDTAGNRAPVPVIPVTLRSDTEPKAGGAIKYETRIKLRRLPHNLVLAIFDPQSGKILTARVDVLPPAK